MKPRFSSRRHVAPWVLTAAMALAVAGAHAEGNGPGAAFFAPEGWPSVREAYEAARHAFRPEGSGSHVARNEGQGWRTRVDGRGFTTVPDGGGWTWGLELRRWGLAGREEAVAEGTGSASANRLRLRRGEGLEEWFVNDGRGLEQGWTVHRRPDGRLDQPLRLEFGVRGDLAPRLGPDGVRFVDDGERSAVTYGGLRAWDASGKELASRFALTGEGIAVEVEVRDATFPVVIDPIARQAFLKASNAEFQDRFGTAVAVDGDVAVVGAPNEDSGATTVNGNQADNGASDAGAAYVFARRGILWTQQAYLKPSNGEAGDLFGTSVAVSGNTVVVGAPRRETVQAAYTAVLTGANNDLVFTAQPGTAGNLISVELVHPGLANQALGVSVSGPAITVNLGTDAGMAITSTAADVTAAIQGDAGANALVSVANAGGNDGTGLVESMPQRFLVGSGAAYVYVRSGVTWTQQAVLQAAHADPGDKFGNSVSVSGNTVLVGAPGEASAATAINGDETNDSAIEAGAAYVFVRAAGVWTRQAYLKASNAAIGYSFGWSVAVSGDRTIIGSYREASASDGVDGNEADNSSSFNGAAYIFARTGSTWVKEAYLKGPHSDSSDQFGWAVAISGDLAVAGAVFEASASNSINGDSTDNTAPAAGAAFVFERKRGKWVQEAYLKASDAASGHRFGISVGISGTTVAVGAHFKNLSQGCTYVFSRWGGSWNEDARLVSPHPDNSDQFGIAVGVSGDTVLVGVPEEDSNSLGINGDGANNGTGASGAAYVFTGAWPFYPSVAKASLSAPGADDLAYGRPVATVVSDTGTVLLQHTLAGAGAPLGREVGTFSNLGPSGALDLLVQKGDDIAGFGDGYLPGSRVTSLFSPSLNQNARGGLFQVVVAGPGIGALNNRALVRDDGTFLRLVRRTGRPLAAFGGADASVFSEVLQSFDSDQVAVPLRLRQSIATSVGATNDSGILAMDHTGTALAAAAPQEGDPAFGGGGNFGQFTGVASAGQGNVIQFSAALLPTGGGAALQGVFHTTANGVTTGRAALQGSPAPGTAGTFGLFPGVGESGGNAVFRASVAGVPLSQNEGVWRFDGANNQPLLLKGVEFDAVNFPGVTVVRILRGWPVGSDQAVFHVVLGGTGVTTANNVAVLLRQSNNQYLALLRTGEEAPGIGLSAARVAAIQAVDVHPLSGRYAILGSLSGVAASANQALWGGRTTAGDDTAANQILRLPSLRFRKGMVYHSERTQRDVVRGLTLRPAPDRTGMGGRGLGTTVGNSGMTLFGVIGDRKLEELLLLLP
jgi:hypothetical protein